MFIIREIHTSSPHPASDGPQVTLGVSPGVPIVSQVTQQLLIDSTLVLHSIGHVTPLRRVNPQQTSPHVLGQIYLVASLQVAGMGEKHFSLLGSLAGLRIKLT